MGEVGEMAWAKIAQAVDDRMRELGLTQKQVGVSPLTLRRLLKDHQPINRREARVRLCEALDWTADSIDRMLDGQDPVELIPSESIERLEVIEARFDDLESDVRAVLEALWALIGGRGPPNDRPDGSPPT